MLAEDGLDACCRYCTSFKKVRCKQAIFKFELDAVQMFQCAKGLFYTHLLSLRLFIPLSPHILRTASTFTGEEWGFLGLNAATQYVCVSGVVGLSSVTLNMVLGLRKVVSLVVSVGVFGGSFGRQSVVGAGLVLVGTLLYSVDKRKKKDE
jgi:drug/metabolite transporter (DMT)-like permease